MSSGFVEKNLDAIHNGTMTDRHTQKLSYPLRMPDEMREKLENAAKENGRSLHAEIVARLSATLEHGVTLLELKDRLQLTQGLLEVKEEVVSLLKERNELGKLTLALAQVLQNAAKLIGERELSKGEMTVEGSSVCHDATVVLDKYRELAIPGHKLVFPSDAYEELGLGANEERQEKDKPARAEPPKRITRTRR